MRELKQFTIPFVGLKIGQHTFDFQITNTFFEHFEYDEFNSASVDLAILLDKKSTLLEFTLSYKGTISLNCDITNEPFDQPVDGSYHFIVKFGDEYNDENEELLILPHGSYEVNIQQYIYETIVLNIPSKRVHPGVEDGTLDSDILDKLEELKPNQNYNKKASKTDETDPRWDTLKKLLNDK